MVLVLVAVNKCSIVKKPEPLSYRNWAFVYCLECLHKWVCALRYDANITGHVLRPIEPRIFPMVRCLRMCIWATREETLAPSFHVRSSFSVLKIAANEHASSNFPQISISVPWHSFASGCGVASGFFQFCFSFPPPHARPRAHPVCAADGCRLRMYDKTWMQKGRKQRKGVIDTEPCTERRKARQYGGGGNLSPRIHFFPRS